MTEAIALEAEKREGKGKGAARALRREGKIPAIIYGQGKEEICVSLDANAVTKEYHKPEYMSRLVELTIGKKKVRTIPRAVQLHPVTDAIEHADFMYIEKGKEVQVGVLVRLLNRDKAPGLKRGGFLNIVRREIDLWCDPDKIPHHIDVDLTGLDIGSSVHISSITLPEGVRPTIERDFTILAVVGRGGKKAATETEGAEGEGAAEAAAE